MYAIDFEYDGQYLSDYGFIICHFDSSTGATVADAGTKISFNKVSRDNGRNYSLSSTKYDECIQSTFDICKNPALYDFADREISNDEYRDIVRWLNRREFLKFQVFDEEVTDRESCYYNVSFNVSKIKIAEKLYGLQLTLESDKPFGYGEEKVFTISFTDKDSSKTLRDYSDEIGYVYPDITITCTADGDITLSNDFESCSMSIKNCKAGETITINGESQFITTDYAGHDISNDFNYEFLKIGNTFNNRTNTIKSTIPCKVVIRYSPIIKDTP